MQTIEKTKTIQSVSYEDAVKAAVQYFNGDDLAGTVWVSKYALKDSYGKIYERSPEEMHRRIAAEIFRIEKKYANPIPEETLYELLKDFKYIIPQGSQMSGIGNYFHVSSL